MVIDQVRDSSLGAVRDVRAWPVSADPVVSIFVVATEGKGILW